MATHGQPARGATGVDFLPRGVRNLAILRDRRQNLSAPPKRYSSHCKLRQVVLSLTSLSGLIA